MMIPVIMIYICIPSWRRNILDLSWMIELYSMVIIKSKCIFYYHLSGVDSGTIVPGITLKNEYVAIINLKGLLGLAAWEILEDIPYYKCIISEILKNEFSNLHDHTRYICYSINKYNGLKLCIKCHRRQDNK